MQSPLDRLDVHAQLVDYFTPVVEAVFKELPATTSSATLLQLRERRARRRLAEALALRLEPSFPDALRAELKNLVVTWKSEDFDDGFGEIAVFEASRAREGDLAWATQHGGESEFLDTLERQYREAVVDRYGKHELRGLQTSTRVLQQLELVFVPLHAEGDVVREEGEDELFALLGERERLPIPTLLARERVVLLIGPPGSGKSTLCAWLASRLANKALPELDASSELLPLLVPVRSLAGLWLDEAAIAEVTSCDRRVVRRALDSRKVLLMIDGVDEAHADNDALWDSVGRLRTTYPGLRLFLTSRPPDGEAPDRPWVYATRLLPMTREDVIRFVEKWCLAAELSVRSDRSPAEANVEASRNTSDLLRRMVQSRAVARLAENPLMCSVICTVHRFMGQGIPERRTALYEACTNVLLYEWDRTKFPNEAVAGRLDASAKRSVLGGLALAMHEANVTEWPEKVVRAVLGERLSAVGVEPLGASRFVEEIRFRSGLLVEQRPGVFAFSHLTFQEYLAAVELLSQGRIEWLIDQYADGRWHDVIVLAAGLPGAPIDDMILRLLDASEYHVGLFLAAQCLDAAAMVDPAIRARVGDSLTAVLPPRDSDTWERLSACPASAIGPVLIRSLERAADPDAAWYLVDLIWQVRFEPAIGALVRWAREEEFDTRRRGPLSEPKWARGLLVKAILFLWSRESRVATEALKSLEADTPHSRSPATPDAPPPSTRSRAPAKATKQGRAGPKGARQSAPSRP